MIVEQRPATAIDRAVARLHGWLETMRGPGGYAGPVVHWWRDCLLFCGAGLDWRYEGIIAGYLTLFERSEDSAWLAVARRAADDLVRGQLLSGHFRNSAFELNPGVGGTPHEAAADIGLLLLARTLRERGDDGWRTYFDAAEKNLEWCYIDRLWNEVERCFRDDPGRASFVPNKTATLIEALCLAAELTGREEYLERYVRPSAETILDFQVRSPGSRLDGAIAQSAIGGSRVESYFPYYNARCVPGMVAAYERLGEARYLEAAAAALEFVLRWREPDGAFPQVVYGNGRVARYPRWIAAVGDVLRAIEVLGAYGFQADPEPTERWLLAGELASGAVRTADGFGSQVSQKPPNGLPDARDLLPVAGWSDKAFRYLATRASSAADGLEREGAGWELPCTYNGREGELCEDGGAIVLRQGSQIERRWPKGADWAEADGWSG